MLRARNVSDGNRSRLDIIAEILMNLRVPICWTNVVSHCNMSSKQSRQYFNLLRSSDLIQMQVAAGRVTYQRTEAGQDLLKHYDNIVLLLNPSICAPSLT